MLRVIAGFVLLCMVMAAATDSWGDDPPAKNDPGVLFRRIDRNGDNRISRDEFRNFVATAQRFKDQPELARGLFDRLDTNRDGSLSLEEVRRLADMRPGMGKGKGKDKPAPKLPAKAETPLAEKPATAEQLAFFEKKIRPVLADHCYSCHSADAAKVKGGLLLDTRDGLRKGGDTGPGLVAGDADASLLIRAMRHHDENLKMPPKEKLADTVIADFERWVAMGAPDPRIGSAKTTTGVSIEEGRKFWSFQPPKKVKPPTVKDESWPVDDVDRFVLAAQEAKGVHPVGDADPRSLIRRLYFDLIGLPPSPAEVTAFVADPSPSAYAAIVDKLLASPRFGERWGRHWLDVARYAESSGKSANFNYPNSWRYRDWVIAAFNADMPYDRFIKEQLAGDLLPAANDKQRASQQIATGFLAIGPKDHNERNQRQFEMDVADEQIDVTSQAFLGLTVACARCHDHKFDPIPSRDYYALAGIFRSTETCYGTLRVVQNQHPTSLIKLPKSAQQPVVQEPLTAKRRAELEKQIEDARAEQAKLRREGNAGGNPMFIRLIGQIAQFESQLASYDADGAPLAQAMGVRDRSRPTDSAIFIRGEVANPGERVPRGVLQVLPGAPRIGGESSGRLQLANWIASKDNPLTARVMVNRIWLHLFGQGLVTSSDNFGASGQAPSHPELLNTLALAFMDNGWSVKSLIRRLVLTRTYRLSSGPNEENEEIDPDNTLFWRMMPQRLDAECLRDGILAISGQLDLTPPVGSPIARNGEGRAVGGPRQSSVNSDRLTVRSVYLPIVRDLPPEMLALFDFADTSLVTGDRPSTSAPSQALFLMNSPFIIRQSEALADKLIDMSQKDDERVDQAFLSIYGRMPSESERVASLEFLAKYEKALTRQPLKHRTAIAAFVQALFASSEFLYRN